MDRSELNPTEPHPAAYEALEYIKKLSIGELQGYLEAFASCSIEGNRLGEICAGTINRLLEKKPVSDRYLLGLAWAIRNIKDARKDELEVW